MAKGGRHSDEMNRKVREMRNAETVLSVIRERGSKGLHLEDVYRQLYNQELYLRAYGRIYSNDGAMTAGTTTETVDGMSQDKINDIIEAIRFERWQWTPVRRTEIPKKNGKTRPLGIPTWSDKLLQEVMRSILEAYYEPQFSEASHGFRPNRGCHTALETIEYEWKGTKWFIEGDIKGCFDNIDHTILLGILRGNIHDNRFLRLVEGLLKAGYMENWKYRETLSGTPQGGIVSPLLANIYLNKLDQFVYDTLLPENNRGNNRKGNPKYQHLASARWTLNKNGETEKAKTLLAAMRAMPSYDTNDPDYRRLRYVRYADDFLFGYVGTKEEAENIKGQITKFLADELRLELSKEKTLITHASESMARFLGHDIVAQRNDTKIGPTGRRSTNGKIALRIPASFIEAKCLKYFKDGKTISRPELENDSDYDIVTRYQQEYRGYYNFYARTVNIDWLNKLNGVMRASLLKTLAHKHKCSVNQIWQQFESTVETPHGPRKCLKTVVPREGKKSLVAIFGGIALHRDTKAVIQEPRLEIINRRTELIKRLLANECEICKSTDRVQVHHVRKLADLMTPGQKEIPMWKLIMSARRRKTLVLCHQCHVDLHAGRPLRRNK